LADRDVPFGLDELEQVAENVFTSVLGSRSILGAGWRRWRMGGWCSTGGPPAPVGIRSRCRFRRCSWRLSRCVEEKDVTVVESEAPPGETVSGRPRRTGDQAPDWLAAREKAGLLGFLATAGLRG
jgi:hypothetical protein